MVFWDLISFRYTQLDNRSGNGSDHPVVHLHRLVDQKQLAGFDFLPLLYFHFNDRSRKMRNHITDKGLICGPLLQNPHIRYLFLSFPYSKVFTALIRTEAIRAS